MAKDDKKPAPTPPADDAEEKAKQEALADQARADAKAALEQEDEELRAMEAQLAQKRKQRDALAVAARPKSADAGPGGGGVKKLTPLEIITGDKETTKFMFPKAVKLTLKDYRVVDFDPGVWPVPNDILTDDVLRWFKAHGVVKAT